MTDAALREDLNLLGDLLDLTIGELAGTRVLDTLTTIRKLGRDAIKDDSAAAQKLGEFLQGLSAADLLAVTKAFSQFLNFANIAEQYHRIRRTRKGNARGSLAEAIPRLQRQGAISQQQFFETICNLDIQLVLTSHPTEVKRRTVMRKYDRISAALQKLDVQVLTPNEITDLTAGMQREMSSVWLTPEVRTSKPTPIDEAKWGLAIIESSIWQAWPAFMRELAQVTRAELGLDIPLDLVPLRIDSWMGGDRDGNPNVTPAVTKQVVYMARWVAADLLSREIVRLRDSLSFKPYNELLQGVLQKLKATKDWAAANFEGNLEPTPAVYMHKDQLLDPLMQCYDGLLQSHAAVLAEGHLTDIIRQVHCFGLHLVRTDIRQEAGRHATLLAAITRELGLGDYASWSETERVAFLLKELQQQRSWQPGSLADNLELQDTIETFKILAKLPRENLGSYIISMTTQASDILGVVLLQRWFGVEQLLPVVPLFETYQDLHNAAAILDKLLSADAYLDIINGYQQIMIGYSDSTKDVGFLAAAWAQYRAQEEMIAVAKKYDLKLVFFHGRGGSVGRGGWPTHQAILAQPPGSINGGIRVTQQGEVIQQRFALRDIALRTFSVYTTSVLEAELSPPPQPKPQWRELMDDLARVAAVEYKKIINESPKFLEYFQQVTPTMELRDLAIGSRPSSRNNVASLGKLRAIPWVFAWTQNRLLLPTWAGVGDALQYAYTTGRGAELNKMYKQWPFFKTLISMLEMVLAKVETNIARHYEQRLGAKECESLGSNLRDNFAQTRATLLQILQQDKLLVNSSVLDRSIDLRNPYLWPLHFMQVELLHRVRDANNAGDPQLRQALFTSIAGIAAGMRNTG